PPGANTVKATACGQCERPLSALRLPGPAGEPGGSAGVRLQGRQRAAGDLLDGPGRVDADQDGLVRVERDERGRLVLVDLQPVPDDLFLVVVALEELAAAVIADPLAGRRVVELVPDPLATPTGPAARQPPDDLILIDDQFEYDGEPDVHLGEDLLE